MHAYSIRIDERQVGIVLSELQLGGNDKMALLLPYCSEHNASVYRAKCAYLGNSFAAIEVSCKPEDLSA